MMFGHDFTIIKYHRIVVLSSEAVKVITDFLQWFLRICHPQMCTAPSQNIAHTATLAKPPLPLSQQRGLSANIACVDLLESANQVFFAFFLMSNTTARMMIAPLNTCCR